MELKVEIKFSLVFIFSIFIHIFVIVIFIMPFFNHFQEIELLKKLNKKGGGARDIIVNINQDNVKERNKYTLLSDKDSSAKGYLTKKRGNNWLNNSLEYRLKSGRMWARKVSSSTAQKSGKDKLLITQNADFYITLLQKDTYYSSLYQGQMGRSEWTKIPDKKGVNLKNAIFYSNSGKFSFNTKKFKHFIYFRNMKKKVSQNWFPPIAANMILPRNVNPLTGRMAPGYTKIMVVPSQIVKLYFIMDRNGNVTKVKIVDSLDNRTLNDSCIRAIKDAKSFGRVPDDIKGEFIVIPFMFGYFVR